MINSKIKKLIMSAAIMLSMGCSFTLGCGRTQENISAPTNNTNGNTALPDHVIAQLTDCTKQGAAHLKYTEHTISFNVDVTKDGQVHHVEVNNSTFNDQSLETCMLHALQDMSLSVSTTAMRSSPLDRPVASQSRALVGNPAIIVVGGTIALAPIIIEAAGVTAIVGIFVYTAPKVAKRIPRCSKVKTACIASCADIWIGNTPNTVDEFTKCWKNCMSAAGC